MPEDYEWLGFTSEAEQDADLEEELRAQYELYVEAWGKNGWDRSVLPFEEWAEQIA